MSQVNTKILIAAFLVLIVGLNGCTRERSVTPTAIPTAPPATNTVAASPTPRPSPTPEVLIYTVEPGDTLLSIAQEYGVTVEAIIEANPDLEDPDLLQIDQQLKIPRP